MSESLVAEMAADDWILCAVAFYSLCVLVIVPLILKVLGRIE